MELGIIDMFLGHLREEKAPTSTTIPRQWKLDADFAHLSLVALGGAERFIDDPRYLSHSRAVENTWPGIFEWCSYIYNARAAPESAQERRMFLDSIVRLFYVLSRFNTFIMAIIRSAGCIELVAKCWALETSQTEHHLGADSHHDTGDPALGKHDVYERVIRAAGGDANSIVQLLLGRVRKAAKTFNPDLGALGLSWHIDLLVELCQPCPHALRRGFFDAGVIAIVTSAFVALSRAIDQNPTPDSVSLMVSCFKFFSRYLEGDDYPSLVHVVKAGFLAAFLDCSSAFHRMPKESQEAALYIVRRVLPPYLVYRSFIEAVKNATDRLRTPHYQALLAQPVIGEAFRPFITLFAKRRPHVEYMHKLESKEKFAQSEGAPAECDYTKCRRIDVENTFMRCSACHVVSYCSAECQKLAWKSAHRVACKQLKYRPAVSL
ncbi:hypothetical protein B0H13DRAFT_1634751 [Mycena leptocephala]|nr:hypothetical protein B0H13DRAFT_1634751 [Mycena leptocephala]